MSETEVNKLLDQLIRVAPDRFTKRRAMKMRARLALPMEQVLDKVPGKSVIAKADHLGVSRQTIYAWIDGTMRPNLKRAKQLAKLTGFDVDEIRGLGA